MLIAVWAMDENNLIGRGSRLPWSIPAELNHFYRVIQDQKILVGRKTFDHLPISLKKKWTILVLSQQQQLNYHYQNVKVVSDVAMIISQYAQHSMRHLYVIGGRQIYHQLWNYFDRLVVSRVKGSFQGDVYFPTVNWDQFQIMNQKSYPKFRVTYYQRQV